MWASGARSYMTWDSPTPIAGGGCVKAGIADFRKLLFADRNWYVNWWESGEERVRQHLGKNVSILRDRSGKRTRPMTLREMRERIDALPTLFEDETEGLGCGVCFLEGPVPTVAA